MNKEYWVIKLTDNDQNWYVYQTKPAGRWNIDRQRVACAKYSSLKNCKDAIAAFLSTDEEDYLFQLAGHYCKVRPVKVKIKKPAKFPPINSVWQSGYNGDRCVVTGIVNDLVHTIEFGYHHVDNVYYEPEWEQHVASYNFKMVSTPVT